MVLSAAVFLYLISDVWTMNYEFPKHFKFGAATSAHQIEGAWNVSDKSPSMWDVFTHTKPDAILDHSTADVACDSYNQWERDVEMASELGLHFYRFSISWTRILPSGFPNHISKDGVQYYNNLINSLLKKNIEPVVTMYQYDLPVSIYELGQFLRSPLPLRKQLTALIIFTYFTGAFENAMIVNWFADYAKVLYTLFGDRVNRWLTFNEPLIFCGYAYNTGNHPPSVKSPGIGDYICLKNVMLAHAKAWRIYDEEFKPKYKGKVAILNQIIWNIPADEDNLEAAEAINQYGIGMYSHPIYSALGGWPSEIESAIAMKSQKEGYFRSRVPKFTEEEIQYIKGTYDFYGFNYYTSRVAYKPLLNETLGIWPLNGAQDLGIAMKINPDWFTNKWFSIYPKGIREALVWIKKNYGDIEIFIAENGYLSNEAELDDRNRALYIKEHLEQVLLAIHEDQVNVTAYTVWSLMDNFDWDYGYSSMFGLYEVDFKDPKRKRTPRMSAHYYSNIIRNHYLAPLSWSNYFKTSSSKAVKSISSFTTLISFSLTYYLLCNS